MISSLGDSNETLISEAEDNQSNLFENIVEFNKNRDQKQNKLI